MDGGPGARECGGRSDQSGWDRASVKQIGLANSNLCVLGGNANLGAGGGGTKGTTQAGLMRRETRSYHATRQNEGSHDGPRENAGESQKRIKVREIWDVWKANVGGRTTFSVPRWLFVGAPGAFKTAVRKKKL